eukprot:g30164.t1
MGQLARAAAPKPTVQDFLGSESLFAGQWRVGQKHGHGTAIYALGEFEGQWVNGKRHGQAVLSYQGYQLEGPWVDDLPDEQASHMIFYPEGTKYTGRVRVYANGEDAAGEGRLWTPWNIVPEAWINRSMKVSFSMESVMVPGGCRLHLTRKNRHPRTISMASSHPSRRSHQRFCR